MSLSLRTMPPGPLTTALAWATWRFSSVEPAGPDSDELSGDSTIGGANAYSTRIKGYDVTAVGEVPSDTVRMIARSVRTQSAAIAAQ